MIHKICDICGEMESVDFMIKIDDDYFCIECDEKVVSEEENENTMSKEQE